MTDNQKANLFRAAKDSYLSARENYRAVLALLDEEDPEFMAILSAVHEAVDLVDEGCSGSRRTRTRDMTALIHRNWNPEQSADENLWHINTLVHTMGFFRPTSNDSIRTLYNRAKETGHIPAQA
jgi:hypothetical protein